MLAMATDFHGESRISAKIKESLARIKKAGFSHIHWCHEWTGSYLYSLHEMLQFREWCEEFGLGVKGVHASSGESGADLKDYCSFNEYSRLAGLELVKNRVDLARILDAGAIVLHFNLPWKRFEAEPGFRERFYGQALKSFDELEGWCKNARVKLCVENESGAPPVHSCFMFDTLFRRYDKDYMGLCFDTGHALMACGDKCLQYAEQYNDRLFMIHVHDNHGEGDEHLIPFDGKFNWEGFAPVLARSAYRLPVLLESMYREAGDPTLWLEKAFEMGSLFSVMVEKAKPSCPGVKPLYANK